MAFKFLDEIGVKYLFTKIKSLISGKADKSTTLAGYGITNAYTKTEVDTAINNGKYTLPNATSSVLGGVKVGTNISVSSGTISVANGSTSAKGVVKLSSATNSTSTSLAATASAVKAAYDLANGKQSPATSLSGYGITDAYTKTQVDNLIANAGGGSGGNVGGGWNGQLTSFVDIEPSELDDTVWHYDLSVFEDMNPKYISIYGYDSWGSSAVALNAELYADGDPAMMSYGSGNSMEVVSVGLPFFAPSDWSDCELLVDARAGNASAYVAVRIYF